MANKDFDIQIKVRATSEDAALSLVEKQLGNVSAKIRETGAAAKSQEGFFGTLQGKVVALAGTYFGLQTALNFVKDAFKGAIEGARSWDNLASSMRGQVNASDASIASLQAWIEEAEKASGIAKEEMIPGFQALLAATQDAARSQTFLQIALGAVARRDAPNLETALSNITRMLTTGSIRATDAFSVALRNAGKDGVITTSELGKLLKMYGDMGAGVHNAGLEVDRAKVAWDNTKESIGGVLQSVFIPLFPVLKGLSVFLGMVVAGTVGLGNAFAELLIMIPEGLARLGQFIPIVGKSIGKWADGLTDLRSRMRTTAEDYMQAVMDGVVGANSKAESSILGVKAQLQGMGDIKLPGADKKDAENLKAVEDNYDAIIAQLNEILDLTGAIHREEYKPIEPKAVKLDEKTDAVGEMEQVNERLEELNKKHWTKMTADELRLKLRLYQQEKAAAIKAGKDTVDIENNIKRAKIELLMAETEARIAQLQGIVSAHTAAGKLLFRASQALGIAKALMAAPEAYSKDVAQYGSPLGPILGAIDAALCVAQAAAIASQKMPSAAGGWDVPDNVDPVAQIHRKEMVLPAELATVFRKLAEMGFATQTNTTTIKGQTTNVFKGPVMGGWMDLVSKKNKAERRYNNLYPRGNKNG